MTWGAFYNYLAAMLLMTGITVGLIVYAIVKNDYSKRTNMLIISVMLIDLILVTLIFFKLWF
ncbi:MAG TPA: hypothetical protein ENK46_01335 [Flavobacteriia bacterium]|nr:hypothetical protein [Flavobacteriia bacterium]